MATPSAAGIDLDAGVHENDFIYTCDLIYTGAGVEESTGVHENDIVYTGILIYTGGLLQGLQGLI